MKPEIAAIRKDYLLKSLSEADVKPDAIEQFTEWWNEALKSEIDEVNAMTVATVNASGEPGARICLLKSYDENGFIFFTNYNSSKGQEIAANTSVCLLFFWKELERQVRIDGIAEKITDAENDEYFFSRPVGSRIGAWSSPQSQPIASRDVLVQNAQKYQEQFGENVPRPAHWGGYVIKPKRIEFWQGRSSRLHDRIVYTKLEGGWKIERLAP